MIVYGCVCLRVYVRVYVCLRVHVPLGSVTWGSVRDLPLLLVPDLPKLIWTKNIRVGINVFTSLGT